MINDTTNSRITNLIRENITALKECVLIQIHDVVYIGTDESDAYLRMKKNLKKIVKLFDECGYIVHLRHSGYKFYYVGDFMQIKTRHVYVSWQEKERCVHCKTS